MAKIIWQARVFEGGPLFAASTATQVTVIDKADDTLADLWSDRDGLSVKGNPFFITVAGKIEMYLDPGRYRVTASKAGQTDTWEDVLIIDPDAGGGGTGNVPAGGTTGQVLAKASNTNYDTEWVVAGGGSDRRTVTAVTSSSGIVTLNYALGDYFTLELSENVGGWIISNPPASGIGATIAVEITQDVTARTVAFGAQYNFTASSPLDTVPTSGQALLIMTSFDGGDTWWLTMDTLA